MVLGAPRKGLKVTYCTDTRPVESIVTNGAESDLMILEGMYGESDKLAKARELGVAVLTPAQFFQMAGE